MRNDKDESLRIVANVVSVGKADSLWANVDEMSEMASKSSMPGGDCCGNCSNCGSCRAAICGEVLMCKARMAPNCCKYRKCKSVEKLQKLNMSQLQLNVFCNESLTCKAADERNDENS